MATFLFRLPAGATPERPRTGQERRPRPVPTASQRRERKAADCTCKSSAGCPNSKVTSKGRGNKMTARRPPPEPIPTDATIMTLLYTDPLFLKHDTGPRHPETAARLR